MVLSTVIGEWFSRVLFGTVAPSPLTAIAPVSQEFYDTAVTFSHLSNVAYCINTPFEALQSDFTCGVACSHFPDIELVEVFGGQAFETSITGFLAIDHVKKEKYVVYRGTYDIGDVYTDIQMSQSPFLVTAPLFNSTENQCQGCTIHDGWNKAYKETMDIIGDKLAEHVSSNPDYKLIVTGHSLGAAIAVLSATSLKVNGFDPYLYNYGQPRIGNGKFADFVSKVWFGDGDGLSMDENRRLFRLTHWNDLFVGFPAFHDYVHSVGEIYIDYYTVNPPLNTVHSCAGPESMSCYRKDFDALERVNILKNHLAYFDWISYCTLNVGRRGLERGRKFEGQWAYGGHANGTIIF
ncbi:Feruloyl esterase A [Yarrowia sp. B02]|nr:Feruloyl esterase A [Yarrowia sp. B02]